MRWIAKHPRLAAVTIIAIVLVAVIFVSSLIGRQDNEAGNAVRAAMAAVQKPFLSGLDWLAVRISSAITDDILRSENEAMKEELFRLENELASARLEEAELEELRQLRDALENYDPRGNFSLVPARVLAFEGSNVFNVFTIDTGTEAGVVHDTAVIAGGGLVGRVLETNTNSSKVIAIIDESNRIGFEIYGRPYELGVCYGNGRGGLSGEMLDENANIGLGDRIVTNGMGGIYPAGIFIGVVTYTEFKKESSLLYVEIEPAVDFRSLKKVALVI